MVGTFHESWKLRWESSSAVSDARGVLRRKRPGWLTSVVPNVHPPPSAQLNQLTGETRVQRMREWIRRLIRRYL